MTASSELLPPPPEPGAPIVSVVRYYLETAPGLVPGFDLELVPLVGKVPGVGGLAWQDHASSDPVAVLEHLRALGPAGRRVDGLGALMNKHVAFDVDHPEHLPADLAELLAGALVNQTRPGRSHHLFRVPVGRRVGGRKDLLNVAFPPIGGQSWGELKAFNGQVRIWSPNDDGTHVRLLPGVIPEIPVELAPHLMEPEFFFGDPVTSAMLDDWLDTHVGAAHPEWMAVDIARLPELCPGKSNSKNDRVLRRVWQGAINIGAGMYAGRPFYEALYDAYVALCHAEGDWLPENTRKYRGIWQRAVGKLTTDPTAIAKIEEKKLASWTEPFDDTTPEGREFVEWCAAWADREGVRRPVVGVSTDLTDAEMALMLSAVDPDEPERSGEVVDILARRLARLEASRAGAEVPLPPVPRGGVEVADPNGPIVEAIEAPPEIVETRDDENSSLSQRVDEPVSSSGGPDGPEGPSGPDGPAAAVTEPEQSVYERVVAGIFATQKEKVAEERDRLIRRQIAEDWLAEHKTAGKLPTLHRRRPEWTKVPAPDGLLRTDGIGLLYRTKPTTHALIGGKGSGKSTLGAFAACEWMRAGLTVCWIDFEVGIDNVYNQFLTVRGDPELLEERLIVIAMGAEAGGLEGATQAIEADGVVPGLICLDSVARAIARSGLSENAAEAFINLVDSFADRMRDRGSSVLVIDHFGHDDKTRGRGTSTKGDQIDCELTVEVLAGWSRTSSGATRLTCRKDRRGYMVPDAAVAIVEYTPDLSVVDLERRPLDVVIVPPASMAGALAVAAGAAVDAESVAAVVMDVMREEGLGSELSTRQMDKAVRAKGVTKMSSEVLRDALDGLVDDGLLEVRDGPKRSRLWQLAEE